MSRGPGHVHRVILDAVADPAAAETASTAYDPPGPVGVPLTEIYRRLYDTGSPTRSQRESVLRAVRVLRSRDQVDTFRRRFCWRARGPVHSPHHPCGLCALPWAHRSEAAIGRPRNHTENEELSMLYRTAQATVRAAR